MKGSERDAPSRILSFLPPVRSRSRLAAPGLAASACRGCGNRSGRRQTANQRHHHVAADTGAWRGTLTHVLLHVAHPRFSVGGAPTGALWSGAPELRRVHPPPLPAAHRQQSLLELPPARAGTRRLKKATRRRQPRTRSRAAATLSSHRSTLLRSPFLPSSDVSNPAPRKYAASTVKHRDGICHDDCRAPARQHRRRHWRKLHAVSLVRPRRHRRPPRPRGSHGGVLGQRATTHARHLLRPRLPAHPPPLLLLPPV